MVRVQERLQGRLGVVFLLARAGVLRGVGEEAGFRAVEAVVRSSCAKQLLALPPTPLPSAFLVLWSVARSSTRYAAKATRKSLLLRGLASS